MFVGLNIYFKFNKFHGNYNIIYFLEFKKIYIKYTTTSNTILYNIKYLKSTITKLLINSHFNQYGATFIASLIFCKNFFSCFAYYY